MCSKLKQEQLSRSPADLKQICESLAKEAVKRFQSNIAKKQRIEFLDCYDITERKRGLWVSRKKSEKKEEYNYKALVPCLEFLHRDLQIVLKEIWRN